MSQNRWSFSAIRFKKTRQVRLILSNQCWNWRCFFRTRPEAARECRRFDARRLDRQSRRLAAAPDAQEQHSRLQRRQIGAQRSPTRWRPSRAAAGDAREPKSYSTYAAAVCSTGNNHFSAKKSENKTKKIRSFAWSTRLKFRDLFTTAKPKNILKKRNSRSWAESTPKYRCSENGNRLTLRIKKPVCWSRKMAERSEAKSAKLRFASKIIIWDIFKKT